ncbi:MAG: hypothetical protein HQK49_00520 [Oligoflexia bacterium]|nr:hypothetical protein [Oligoflexia bacterium]
MIIISEVFFRLILYFSIMVTLIVSVTFAFADNFNQEKDQDQEQQLLLKNIKERDILAIRKYVDSGKNISVNTFSEILNSQIDYSVLNIILDAKNIDEKFLNAFQMTTRSIVGSKKIIERPLLYMLVDANSLSKLKFDQRLKIIEKVFKKGLNQYNKGKMKKSAWRYMLSQNKSEEMKYLFRKYKLKNAKNPLYDKLKTFQQYLIEKKSKSPFSCFFNIEDVEDVKDVRNVNKVTMLSLSEEDKRYSRNVLDIGKYYFTKSPAKAVEFLISKGEIADNSPMNIAKFLYSSSVSLDKRALCDYLGSESQKLLLKEFIDQFDFTNMNIIEAIREMVKKIYITGESQKIDRILSAFGKKYASQNNSSAISADTAYSLSYSIMMLNTDLHNSYVKEKMKMDEFVKVNKKLEGVKDLREEMLEGIYKDIRDNELKFTGGNSLGGVIENKQYDFVDKIIKDYLDAVAEGEGKIVISEDALDVLTAFSVINKDAKRVIEHYQSSLIHH